MLFRVGLIAIAFFCGIAHAQNFAVVPWNGGLVETVPTAAFVLVHHRPASNMTFIL